MKVAIVGATGRVGTRIVRELLDRGHEVTAISRLQPESSNEERLQIASGDSDHVDALAEKLRDHDVVVTAVPHSTTDPMKKIEVVRRAGVARYLVVGGASTLLRDDGTRLLDNADFPDAYRTEATAGASFLELLRETDDIDWTFLSPSAEIVPGERTNRFRLGKDHVLVDADGKSWISFEDYAVAMVDEIETPAHHRTRFTVGY
jgi:putative NADH-flavin reductase